MTWYHPALAQRTIDAGDRIIDGLKAENARLREALEEIVFAVELDEARRTASVALNQQV